MCSEKQSVNVTRSTGTDADCSCMDNNKNSQFNMIVYVRKMLREYHNRIAQPIPSTKRKRKPRRTETT